MTVERVALTLGLVAADGCSRDNPLFDADGGLAPATTGAEATSASQPTDPFESDPTKSTSDGGVDDTASSEPGTVSSSESHGSGDDASTSTTGATCSMPDDATVVHDAFLVSSSECSECSTANFGASVGDYLYQGVQFAKIYVARMEPLPLRGDITSATLTTDVSIYGEPLGVSLSIHAFLPPCEWQEGTQIGPDARAADGITWQDCDPITPIAFPGGDPRGALGELLGTIDLGTFPEGASAVAIELSVDAVKQWLDDGSASLALSIDSSDEVLFKPAREAMAGDVTLSFEHCD